MKITSFRDLVHQRFDAECTDKMGRDTLLGIISMAEEFELVEDVVEYLRSHPEATVYDTSNYIDTIAPEQIIEIVDDDELED